MPKRTPIPIGTEIGRWTIIDNTKEQLQRLLKHNTGINRWLIDKQRKEDESNG